MQSASVMLVIYFIGLPEPLLEDGRHGCRVKDHPDPVVGEGPGDGSGAYPDLSGYIFSDHEFNMKIQNL